MESNVEQTIPTFSIDALLQLAKLSPNKLPSIKAFLEWTKLDAANIDALSEESLEKLETKYQAKVDDKFALGPLDATKVLQAASLWSKEQDTHILDAWNVAQDTAGKLPELQNFISRGKVTEENIQLFIQSNIKNFPYQEKQKYWYLYIIGSRGYGKTWIGKYVPSKIQQYYPETKVVWILLDFSTGDEFHNYIDSEDEGVSLGFRVAARFLFQKSSASTLEDLQARKCAVDYRFRIAFGTTGVIFSITPLVVKRIRENLGVAPQERLHMCLQFDEPQMEPDLVRKLLHALGSFSVNCDQPSDAELQNTIIFPVITGTSSKGIKMRVPSYSQLHIQLTPFSFLDSCQLLNKLCPSLTPWKELGDVWDRLVMSAGGLPRLLSLLAECIKNFEAEKPDLQLLQNMWVTSIEANYQVSEWSLRFGGIDNMRTIIEWSLLRKPVFKETVVGDCTIEDIMQEGVLFLAPADNVLDQTHTTYYILFPQIFLWMINSKHLFITEHDVLNPVHFGSQQGNELDEDPRIQSEKSSNKRQKTE